MTHVLCVVVGVLIGLGTWSFNPGTREAALLFIPALALALIATVLEEQRRA